MNCLFPARVHSSNSKKRLRPSQSALPPEGQMRLGAIGRLGLIVIAGAVLGSATGCTSIPMAGWGPPSPNTGAPVAAQQGAPRFVQTTGMRVTDKEETVKV